MLYLIFFSIKDTCWLTMLHTVPAQSSLLSFCILLLSFYPSPNFPFIIVSNNHLIILSALLYFILCRKEVKNTPKFWEM